jgi:hypothetical protein
MSEIKVNKISQRSGTAITLGNSGTDFQLPSGAELVAQSGSTITIAAGATITNNGSSTGFGATGAVNWDTTKITADPNPAVSGVGYFADTSSAAFTVTLPAAPSAGDIVALSDYTGTWNTNNITVGRNSSNINGAASDLILNQNNTTATLIYVDATEGWRVIDTGSLREVDGVEFVAATGGTVTCCGDYKIHTFTGPGTFTVTSAGNPLGSTTVDYLVVAGGGGGGWNANNSPQGGSGGGGGGFRMSNSTCMPAPITSPLASPTGLPVSVQGYPITVGAGGAAASPTPNTNGKKGVDSVFSTITSTGGGFGSGDVDQPSNPGEGGPGGSGGGAHQATPTRLAGSGNTPPTSPPQGNTGGSGSSPSGEGGGGAGGVAINSTPGSNAGSGGVGSFVAGSGFAGCNGTPGPVPGARYFAGGGGGSNSPARSPTGANGSGGAGGGANGSSPPAPAGNATVNTGGGGGGASCTPGLGAGGSGIVIIRYKYQ